MASSEEKILTINALKGYTCEDCHIKGWLVNKAHLAGKFNLVQKQHLNDYLKNKIQCKLSVKWDNGMFVVDDTELKGLDICPNFNKC